MVIGIEASLAFTKNKAGPENYYFQIIKHLLEVDDHNFYKLYVPKNIDQNIGVNKKNYQFVVIDWPRLWTQGGLALECLLHPPEVLFVPAHTMPIIRWPNLKVVVTIHDLGAQFLPQYHQFPHKYYLNLATEYAAAHASHLIAISQATKEDLISQLKVDPKRITVVYEGYDKSYLTKDGRLTASLQRYGLVKGNYFLFVGTIQPRKNLERLIRAYAKYLQESKRTKQKTVSQLVLAGGKGWLSDEIYQLPKKLGIEESVRFLGYIPKEDLPALLGGARALLYPSLFEGFGLPILEAFACRTPVLTSKISSMPEVAGSGAILVDPFSIDDIASGIWELAEGKKSARLIKAGQKQLQKFSWEKCARETLAILEDIGKK